MKDDNRNEAIQNEVEQIVNEAYGLNQEEVMKDNTPGSAAYMIEETENVEQNNQTVKEDTMDNHTVIEVQAENKTENKEEKETMENNAQNINNQTAEPIINNYLEDEMEKEKVSMWKKVLFQADRAWENVKKALVATGRGFKAAGKGLLVALNFVGSWTFKGIIGFGTLIGWVLGQSSALFTSVLELVNKAGQMTGEFIVKHTTGKVAADVQI